MGGVSSAVLDGRTGRLVARDDEVGFADAVRSLLEDPEEGRRLGENGREHVLGRFSMERLVADIDDLYRRLGTQEPV